MLDETVVLSKITHANETTYLYFSHTLKLTSTNHLMLFDVPIYVQNFSITR